MNEDHTLTERYLKGLPPGQRRAVEDLLRQTRPYRSVPSPLAQWAAWLGLAVLVAGLSLVILHPQEKITEILLRFPSGPFLALCFLGSAVAAWMAIGSSMPGYEPGPVPKYLAFLTLAALFAMPLLFFQKDDLSSVLSHDMATGWFCFRTVFLVAVPAWALLGWMISRNASFRPGWTGFWLGASSFLLGTGTIQSHCSHWECCHMLLNHLMPLWVFIAFPIWLGAHWFSRWEK